MPTTGVEPLERRMLQVEDVNGLKQDQVAAVDSRWCQSRQWMPFTPPPQDGQDAALNGAWKDRVIMVLDDLDFLLGLECHKFWSQLLFDDNLHSCLERMLLSLPRPYDLTASNGSRPEDKLVNEVSRKLFLVFLRLSTHKESAENFWTPAALGELLYDNFLLDVPRLMDLCCLYRPWAPNLLEKMMASVFLCQPKYKDDLRQSLETISAALTSAADRTEVLVQFSCDTKEQLAELNDLVSYATDVSVSLGSLLECHSPLADVIYRSNFCIPLANFYQHVLVPLGRYIFRHAAFIQTERIERLSNRLLMSRKACVNILRTVVQVSFVAPTLDGKTGGAEAFLELFSSCLSEGGAMLVDYGRIYSISEDIDVLQAKAAVDATRVAYVVDGVRRVEEEMQEGAVKAEAKRALQADSQVQKSQLEDRAKSQRGDDIEPVASTVAASTADVEMDSLISQVRDLLPDLGEGFVQSCLEYYDNQPEAVINSLLEENLPPHLIEMDRKMGRKAVKAQTDSSTPQAPDTGKTETPANRTTEKIRSNVFDGDEFDVTSRDSLDLTRIHKGKKSKGKSADRMLEDKEELSSIRDRFQALSMVAEVEDADYDDEYDDTYDDNAVGQSEPDAKEESDALLERRPFVLPRALGGGHIAREVAVKEDEEEEDEEEERKKKDHFVRNPEEVRAEKERKRQTQQQQRGGGGGGGPKRDVVGKPKGQGQDKSVLINRARKNANKGKSHRAAADRKQGKGMF